MLFHLLACFGLDTVPDAPGWEKPPLDSGTDSDDPVRGDCYGTRFEVLATPWRLPAGFPDGTFMYATDTSTSSPNWVMLDLDDKGGMDLFVTYYEGLTDVGTSKWLVYENAGDGFEGAAGDWALPTGFPSQAFYMGYDTSSASPNWALLDLDGDGTDELVVTYYDILSGVGDSSWMVYTNNGSGFDTSGTTWSLPVGFPSGTFWQATDSSTSSPNWTLMDIDGDGAPELVVTEYDGIEGLGDTRWLVYSNTGSGWSSTGDTFSLPTGFPAGQFSLSYDSSTSSPNWAVRDMDGDGLLEMLVTYYEGFEGVGTTHWFVYAGDSGGFDSVSTSWDLPVGYTDGYFRSGYDTGTDSLNWALTDLHGDGVDDLVIQYEAISGANAKVGTTKWLVHENEGTGFASAPDNWLLPNGYTDGAFMSSSMSSGSAYYRLADMNGEGLDDLLVTWRSDDETTGLSEWLWYPSVCE
ncbi:MAG: VCBS repeat-containing protein [Proteobacteria bacterium]|nr:VCBS repeat-containing protein [Pseudomonadota bacterium]MCP4916420.1 VCBS repeat-containing protein [Pseudomonadota bacterium]